MNGDTRIFWRTTRLALLVSAAMTLAACAAVTDFEPGATSAVDPASPAAAAVARAAKNPGPWPTFADIPEIPADVRAPEAWRSAVTDQEAVGAQTLRDGAENTWSLTATDSFAARAQAEAGALRIQAPTDAEIAESEAYARALRARATPPPSPR